MFSDILGRYAEEGLLGHKSFVMSNRSFSFVLRPCHKFFRFTNNVKLNRILSEYFVISARTEGTVGMLQN